MTQFQRILVPCDFSPTSDAAVDRACQLAETSGAELQLLHVLADSMFSMASASVVEERKAEALHRLENLLTPHALLKLRTKFVVSRGAVSREVLRHAQDVQADLIVIGTHGRSGLAHLALGSVAEQVLRHAPCPVLAIRHSPVESASEKPAEHIALPPPGEATPAVDLLQRAVSVRATDIHVDPWQDEEYLVRFRIDGHLEKYCLLDRGIAEHLIHQLKIMANQDVADPFRPKEGRLRMPPELPDLEVRSTIGPVAGGEAVALRLFSRTSVALPLEQLGLVESARQRIDQMLRRGEGIILVTGPTGSGKTTTVYAMLAQLGGIARNIVSIEDPVEYPVPFVRQMSVDDRHGVTMTSGLKTILRMDPDAVFVGEIRDVEAAHIAMRAASSGKYVFSTLHTRDVAATITALRDLNIDSRSLAGNLVGIVNERLVRRLCEHCRRAVPLRDADPEYFTAAGIEAPAEVFDPSGCPNCRNTGYRGRVGVFEVAMNSLALSKAIIDGMSEDEFRQLIRSSCPPSLTVDAMQKVKAGITSLSEALEMSWA